MLKVNVFLRYIMLYGHSVCGRRLLDWVVTFNGYEIYNFDNGDHKDNYDFALKY